MNSRTVKSVTESVFPGTARADQPRFFPTSKQIIDSNQIRDFNLLNELHLGTEILSDLPLQVFLYYNVQFSLVYFVLELSLFFWKVNIIINENVYNE